MILEGEKIYTEAPHIADDYRRRYIDGVEAFIKTQYAVSQKLRTEFLNTKELAKNPEKFRNEYKRTLGLDAIPECDKKAESVYVASDDICDIYRVAVYPVAEIPFYCLLLVPHGAKKSPLFIAQHGGGGTPELCCDIYGKNNYNHLAQRALKRGAVVLAPQLMLWSNEETETMRAHKIHHDRRGFDNALKSFGLSITALEMAGIMKGIDYASQLPYVDSDKIMMAGISYGGYFTLHTMAADARIKAGYTAAAFNDRSVYNWSDWCYKNSAVKFHDAEVAALCAPRKLYVSVGKEDKVFDYNTSVAEAQKAHAYFKAMNCEKNFCFNLWDGGHTIPDDSDAFDFIFSAIED